MYSLARYACDRFSLLMPDGADWHTRHLRRTYSSRNVVRTCGETTITTTLYPRTNADGEYRDRAHFLRATQRLPDDVRIEQTKQHATVIYTDGVRDRYYALVESPRTLVEIDCTLARAAPAPPLVAMRDSVIVPASPEPNDDPVWETITLQEATVRVPADWTRKDEYNRPLAAAHPGSAGGIAVMREAQWYATRQLSPPQYRAQPIEPGKNLRSYLVGIKTERHKSSIDGATYQFVGEDSVRSKQARGTRLRYRGYSPSGIRGPMEWYHEVILLEVGTTPLLITAYCDWIERHRYAPVFARITQSWSRNEQ